MLDVDHFKRFNDTFGHDAGDIVLKHIGEILKRCVRQGDVACRFGGEEFVVVLPGTGVRRRSKWPKGCAKASKSSRSCTEINRSAESQFHSVSRLTREDYR
jgi:diguanylate cyclase (GGDEF)-like protein